MSPLTKQANNKATEQAQVDKIRKVVSDKERERNALKEGLNSTKTLNDQDREIIRNEDTSPSEKEGAEGIVEERQEELARLQT